MTADNADTTSDTPELDAASGPTGDRREDRRTDWNRGHVHLTVCGDCHGLFGPFRDPDGRALTNLDCACGRLDPAIAAEQQEFESISAWEQRQRRVAAGTLCKCCARAWLPDDIRWAIWVCEACKHHLGWVNHLAGRVVVPKGRHSIVNTIRNMTSMIDRYPLDARVADVVVAADQVAIDPESPVAAVLAQSVGQSEHPGEQLADLVEVTDQIQSGWDLLQSHARVETLRATQQGVHAGVLDDAHADLPFTTYLQEVAPLPADPVDAVVRLVRRAFAVGR